MTRVRPPIDRPIRGRRGPALAALTLGCLLGAPTVHPAAVAWAQPAAGRPTPAPASADDEPLPRWDASGLLGWRAVRVETTFPRRDRDWEQWLTYGGTVGYYLTPHLKPELDIGGTGTTNYRTYREVPLPGQPFPGYVYTEHRVTTASFAGHLLYQFGENAYFHPFVGVGAALLAARDRQHTPLQRTTIRRPDGTFEEVLTAEPSDAATTTRDGAALVIIGFKAYPSERTFMRSDLQWTVGSPGQRFVSWRIGIGRDF